MAEMRQVASQTNGKLVAAIEVTDEHCAWVTKSFGDFFFLVKVCGCAIRGVGIRLSSPSLRNHGELSLNMLKLHNFVPQRSWWQCKKLKQLK